MIPTEVSAPRFTVEDDSRMTRQLGGQRRFCIYDDDFGYDAAIRIHGDFATSDRHREYVQAVCDALNGAQMPTADTSKYE